MLWIAPLSSLQFRANHSTNKQTMYLKFQVRHFEDHNVVCAKSVTFCKSGHCRPCCTKCSLHRLECESVGAACEDSLQTGCCCRLAEVFLLNLHYQKCNFLKCISQKCILQKFVVKRQLTDWERLQAGGGGGLGRMYFSKCIFQMCIFTQWMFQMCIFPKCTFQMCILQKCIFPKCYVKTACRQGAVAN